MHSHQSQDPAAAWRSAAIAALAALLMLDLGMFASMLGGVEPHPPGARGPFIAATAAMALATLWQVVNRQRAAIPLLALTALAFFPGVGPHKFVTEAAARELAPVILVGSCSLFVLLWAAVRLHRLGRESQARRIRESGAGALG
jgi:hypothetical protein